MMEYRPEIIIHITDKITEVLKPEMTVLEFDIDNSCRTCDVGSWCYSVRSNARNPNHKSRSVAKESIVKDRLKYVERIIEGLRASTYNQATVYSHAGKIARFIDFADSKGMSLSNDKDWIESVYSYYEHLVLSTRLADGTEGSLKERSASAELSSTKKALAWALELTDNEVSLKIPHIKEGKSESLPGDDLERNQFVQVLLAIFERFTDILINEKPFPFVLDLSHWGFGKHVFSRSSHLSKASYTKSFVNDDAGIVSREEVRGRYTDWRECVGVMSVYDNWIKRLDKTNSLNTDLQRKSLYNSATYCYYLAFIGIVGTNNGVTSALRLSSCEKSEPINCKAPRGYSFTGLKVRAGNKTVYPTMGKEFYQFHKKYEKLRQWGEIEFDLDVQRVGFFRISGIGKCAPLNKVSIDTLKEWLIGHLPNVKWHTPRELRKGVSWSFWNLSNGDINTVAWKLQNDVKTTLKSYSNPPKIAGLKELSTFMNEMWNEAIDSSRSAKYIPVQINNGLHKTPAGHCNANDLSQAKRSEGFTDSAPEPNCSRSETCFFCRHYVLHADEEDIHLITSLKVLLPYAQKRAANEASYAIKFAPILYRIDEILEELIKQFPAKKSLVDDAMNKVLNSDNKCDTANQV
ncbi:hypothetical protein [Marinomonas foliarum]|nr:hypothetical protein [Marinomonas foliarum]